MSTVQEARNMVMTLSASERASLAHELILSLDDPANDQLSASQETEIQRRLALVREGTALGRPANEVFEDIRAYDEAQLHKADRVPFEQAVREIQQDYEA
ncbi:MAG: addiction module protein [Verrucomicrobia bacterium]|nr:addiction module protein [Verrucomicrobiota bacterium]MCH8514267.1 addiction module protein [Kiritimatiellia bacterium]